MRYSRYLIVCYGYLGIAWAEDILILAVGDSLTAGQYGCEKEDQACAYAPYGINLEANLERARIIVRGHPGWTSRMILERSEDEAEPVAGEVISNGEGPAGVLAWCEKFRPTLMLLLVGTNDLLGAGRSAKATFQDIESLHERIGMRTGTKVVPIAVPPFPGFGPQNKTLEHERLLLNQKLQGRFSPNFITIPDEALEYTVDGLHWSPAGSYSVGAFLARVLIQQKILETKRAVFGVNGQEIELIGYDSLRMAQRFIQTFPDAIGAGCDTKQCVLNTVAAAIETDGKATAVQGDIFFYAATTRKSKKIPLVIALSSLGVFGSQAGSTNRYEFYKTLSSVFNGTVHSLFLSDMKRHWYLSGVRGLGTNPATTADAILKFVSDSLQEKGFSHKELSEILVVGDSMGGYGALLYGALFALRSKIRTNVLAFNPQTFVSKERLTAIQDHRWPDLLDALHRALGPRPPFSDLIDLWGQDGCFQNEDSTHLLSGHLVYGADRLDTLHANHLATSDCLKLDQRHNLADHASFTRSLRDSGQLKELLINALFEVVAADK